MKIDFTFKKPNMNQPQTRMLVTITIATTVSVFCLLAAKDLFNQAAYHRHVLGARRNAIAQLQSNINNLSTLKTQYDSFSASNPNFLGGTSTTDPNALPPDGDNARLVLDALPSKYDFPALISSVSKIISLNQITNPGIAGSDQTATIDSSPLANPQPVQIPLSISGLTTYNGAENMIRDFERSTRPFDITKLQISGPSGSLSISASLNTYFQPAKVLSTGLQEVQ